MKINKARPYSIIHIIYVQQWGKNLFHSVKRKSCGQMENKIWKYLNLS